MLSNRIVVNFVRIAFFVHITHSTNNRPILVRMQWELSMLSNRIVVSFVRIPFFCAYYSFHQCAMWNERYAQKRQFEQNWQQFDSITSTVPIAKKWFLKMNNKSITSHGHYSFRYSWSVIFSLQDDTKITKIEGGHLGIAHIKLLLFSTLLLKILNFCSIMYKI